MGRQITVTLDDDLAARLEEEARRTGVSVDEVVNEAMRRSRRFVVEPLDLGEAKMSLDCVSAALEAEEAATRK
jgi:predicted transcriptional regulator